MLLFRKFVHHINNQDHPSSALTQITNCMICLAFASKGWNYDSATAEKSRPVWDTLMPCRFPIRFWRIRLRMVCVKCWDLIGRKEGGGQLPRHESISYSKTLAHGGCKASSDWDKATFWSHQMRLLHKLTPFNVRAVIISSRKDNWVSGRRVFPLHCINFFHLWKLPFDSSHKFTKAPSAIFPSSCISLVKY